LPAWFAFRRAFRRVAPPGAALAVINHSFKILRSGFLPGCLYGRGARFYFPPLVSFLAAPSPKKVANGRPWPAKAAWADPQGGFARRRAWPAFWRVAPAPAGQRPPRGPLLSLLPRRRCGRFPAAAPVGCPPGRDLGGNKSFIQNSSFRVSAQIPHGGARSFYFSPLPIFGPPQAPKNLQTGAQVAKTGRCRRGRGLRPALRP
jgi:hypothetical protein